jgi:serine protease
MGVRVFIIFSLANLFFSLLHAGFEKSYEYLPNDPLFASQWAHRNTQSPYDLGVTKVWHKNRGSKKIAIVIIDTGVDYYHPDLINNIWTNPYEIANNGIDDDDNGYIDDIHGINAITGSGDPMDDNGHGTFMAGVIGAEGNNGLGISGVMHSVSLIACKFLDKNGAGSTENAAKCLDYALVLSKRDIGVTIVATHNTYGGARHSDALFNAI